MKQTRTTNTAAHPGFPTPSIGLDYPPLKGAERLLLSIPTPSDGPVYMEGRLVLSLSFQGGAAKNAPDLASIEDDDVVLENFRLWDDLANNWYEEDLAVLRFEHIDVVMRLEPKPSAAWTGALDTSARVVLVPDIDTAGFLKNQAHDLCWKRV